MITEEILCFMPRNIKVIKEVMECCDSKQFVESCLYLFFIHYHTSLCTENTQTQKVPCIHRISCTHSILEVVFTPTLKPILASASHNSYHCFCGFQILPRNLQAKAVLQQLTTE